MRKLAALLVYSGIGCVSWTACELLDYLQAIQDIQPMSLAALDAEQLYTTLVHAHAQVMITCPLHEPTVQVCYLSVAAIVLQKMPSFYVAYHTKARTSIHACADGLNSISDCCNSIRLIRHVVTDTVTNKLINQTHLQLPVGDWSCICTCEILHVLYASAAGSADMIEFLFQTQSTTI